MPQPVDLANVNITLAQFQEISSGKYNAGEVALANETTLTKVNNHVWRTGKNTVTLSHEEVLAIKDAFVRALAAGGADPGELDGVRRELGLAPDGPADAGLRSRSLRPLSRQQIRDILDRTAARINAAQGNGTVRTSAEIYADVSDRNRTSRGARRDSVNASLAGSRTVSENRGIELFQAVVTGDVDFRSAADRAALVRIVREQRDALMQACNGSPRADVPFEASFRTDAGQRVTMQTGASQAAYADRLEEFLVRLGRADAPADAEIAARAAFRALGSDAERAGWLGALAGDPAGGAKARAVAVMLLQDRGVGDHGALSLPNRLHDADAIDFATDLAGANPALRGTALLHSAVVTSAAAKADPAFAPAAGAAAYVPALSDAEWNDLVADGLRAHPDRLPSAFRRMADEVVAEIRDRFGPAVCPDGVRLGDLLGDRDERTVTGANLPGSPRMTPDRLRSSCTMFGVEWAVGGIVRREVASKLAAAGGDPAKAPAFAATVLSRLPRLEEDLVGVYRPDQVPAIVARFSESISDVIRICSACERARAGLAGQVRQALAARPGGGAAIPGSAADFAFATIAADGGKLAREIALDGRASPTDAEIEARFRTLAGTLADAAIADRAAVAAAEREFLEGPGAAQALAAGYARAELPTLARVFAFGRVAGFGNDAAMVKAVLDPQSDPRRLWDYGGRFTASVGNFRAGLRLLGDFHGWFLQLRADIETGWNRTPTALNALPSASSATEEKGTERFLFEEIAVNGEIPLGADDPERIFGMEANPATRFVTRGNASAFALSLSEVPPAERGLVYAVFDAMDPLARTTAERDARLTFPIKDLLAMRVLRNRDAILALRAAGNLDRPHLIALLFDDLGLPPAATNKEAFDVLYDAIQSIASKDLADRPELFSVVQAAIQLNGARKDEAIAAARANGPVPPTPYLSGLACSLTALDGTAGPGLEQMKSDLCRPWMPVFRDGRNVLPDDRNRFVVRFPGEAPIAAEPGATTQPVVARSLREIVDRITDLCGNVHPKQIFAVGFALSQSATSRIDKAFVDRGVLTTEHSPVTFALSKDAETGAVTIRYSEPEGFPFRFHWETTIRPDGSGTSTQLVVENS